MQNSKGCRNLVGECAVVAEAGYEDSVRVSGALEEGRVVGVGAGVDVDAAVGSLVATGHEHECGNESGGDGVSADEFDGGGGSPSLAEVAVEFGLAAWEAALEAVRSEMNKSVRESEDLMASVGNALVVEEMDSVDVGAACE